MPKTHFNKLVRDGIKAKIESKGELCELSVLNDDERFKEELLKKVAEEGKELSQTTSREDFLQEYADLMVALDALTSLLELSEADIKTAIEENVSKKGFFKNRHFLHWSETSEKETKISAQ